MNFWQSVHNSNMIFVYINMKNNMPNEVNVLEWAHFVALKLHDTDTSGILIPIIYITVIFLRGYRVAQKLVMLTVNYLGVMWVSMDPNSVIYSITQLTMYVATHEIHRSAHVR